MNLFVKNIRIQVGKLTLSALQLWRALWDHTGASNAPDEDGILGSCRSPGEKDFLILNCCFQDFSVKPIHKTPSKQVKQNMRENPKLCNIQNICTTWETSLRHIRRSGPGLIGRWTILVSQMHSFWNNFVIASLVSDIIILSWIWMPQCAQAMAVLYESF